MPHLFVAGGRDAGLGFVGPLQSVRPPAALLRRPLALTVLVWRAAVVHLCFPEASLSQEALVHLQLLARLLPAVAPLHLQLLDADLDVLDVVCRDPGSVEEGGAIRNKTSRSLDSAGAVSSADRWCWCPKKRTSTWLSSRCRTLAGQ